MTEEDVLAIIERINSTLCHKFTFGYYDLDDIKQEAFIIAMDGLNRYDSSKPLANFLYVHINNRLKSFKRDNYFRMATPCTRCDNDDAECKYCIRKEKYIAARKNLMNTIEISQVNYANEDNMFRYDRLLEDLESKEIDYIINTHLSAELRSYYLKMKSGVSIPRAKKLKVEEDVLNILEEHNYA